MTVLVTLLGFGGCGQAQNGDAPTATRSAPHGPAGGSDNGLLTSGQSVEPQQSGAPQPSRLPQPNTAPAPPNRAAASQPLTSPPAASPQSPMLEELSAPAPSSPAPPRQPQLPAGWSPTQLVSFLGEADREMRLLINGQAGITDPAEIQAEITRVIVLKRTAAERLMQHADASAADRVVGQRGFLQALSHMASMGDLKAAEELQVFAERFRDDPNPALRSDSQLVLIGLAIESLRHGKDAAATRVLQLVRELLEGDQPADVATLMVLGQAKDTLLQYEYQDEAQEVRQLILARYGSAQDPEVARMAAMIAAAGFSQVDSALQRLDQLRQQFAANANSDPNLESSADEPAAAVSVAQWQDALDEVLSVPADVLTVEFLAGVSLEAEAVGRPDIAVATYDALKTEFAEREDALGQVARTALRARENRKNVIGQVFDPELPSIDGKPLRMTDYQGKVVLVPFWSSAFPDSLAVLPNLLEIQGKYPDRVAIVGMNLDVKGASVAGFAEQQQLGFPSFRSESDPEAAIVNEVAYQFGAVTLLFVAVIDSDGRVVHLEFSGGDLTPEVETLLR